VQLNGVILADTHHGKRVLETSHPPVYYIPPTDIQMDYLHLTRRSTFCEWKGSAGYYTVKVGDRIAENAAWFYANPTPQFAELKDYVAFYPSRMDVCTLNGEVVQAQAGDFYGGWITPEIVGPFKGGVGTWGW
jgi:uncharacterized protein (DUF427 family)